MTGTKKKQVSEKMVYSPKVHHLRVFVWKNVLDIGILSIHPDIWTPSGTYSSSTCWTSAIARNTKVLAISCGMCSVMLQLLQADKMYATIIITSLDDYRLIK